MEGQRYAADPTFWEAQHWERNEAVKIEWTEILPPSEANSLWKSVNNALTILKQHT